MTYKGDRPIIRNNTAIVITDIALINAKRTMFNKIANVLSIISFVMVASMSGGAYFGYKYVTSEQFKARVMNEILGNVEGMMPNVLDNALPKTTGPSIGIPKKKVHLQDDIHFHEKLRNIQLEVEEEKEEEVTA